MDNSFVEHMTQQTTRWCDELDEVVQCPVCMEKPPGKIYLCVQGHHICEVCRAKIINHQCPTCKQDINGGRSFLTENVLSKIEDIKKSIHQHAITNYQSKLTTSSTQYNPEDCRVNGLRVDAAKGLFPCRIGTCTREEPHCRMIEHIKNMHTNRLNICSSTNSDSFRHSWRLHYANSTDYDTAFHVTNMELFFVNLELDVEGHLHGSVQILNSNTIGRMFGYTLEVKGRHRCCKYEGNVKSCRLEKDKLLEDSLFIHAQNLKFMLNRDNTFECELVISRKSEPWVKKNPKKLKDK